MLRSGDSIKEGVNMDGKVPPAWPTSVIFHRRNKHNILRFARRALLDVCRDFWRNKDKKTQDFTGVV